MIEAVIVVIALALGVAMIPVNWVLAQTGMRPGARQLTCSGLAVIIVLVIAGTQIK